MSHFALIAAPVKPAAEGKLNFLSTQTPQEFAKDYCDPGTKVSVVKNPNGNAHPGSLFITWKQGGQIFNGAVSHKLATPEDLAKANLVISITTNPDKQDEYIVLLHEQVANNVDNTVMVLG